MTEPKITSVVAKSEDKTIQITFTIPFVLVQKAQEEVVTEAAKTMEIAGFRPGKAPLEKVRERIAAGDLIEKSLAKILPQALAEAINTDKIRPAIYPKFELLKAEEGKDWEVRASTCELPEVILTDYKKALREQIIKLPNEESHSAEASRDKREQKVIKVLLDSNRIAVPQLLINEEVDARLASLLDRIEKLGLTLEGYLGSIGKTPQGLREEYVVQSKNTIILELLLNKIAEDQKIEVSEQKIDEAIKAASADPKLAERLNTPDQRRLIKGVLGRRATLDYLISLV